MFWIKISKSKLGIGIFRKSLIKIKKLNIFRIFFVNRISVLDFFIQKGILFYVL